MSELPRYAMLGKIRVKVLGYYRNNLFFVLDRGDVRRLVHRDRLVFLP